MVCQSSAKDHDKIDIVLTMKEIKFLQTKLNGDISQWMNLQQQDRKQMAWHVEANGITKEMV
jgi:iron only hydrogenase large subunit-like protein